MNTEILKNKFINTFGSGGDLKIYFAPGRVNLIGEHIDYCGGNVLPAALTVGSYVVARKRDDNIIKLKADDLDTVLETELDKIDSYKGKHIWGEYQLGVISELLKDGVNLVGADMLFYDTIPHGSGLSASAAIEVATCLCITDLSGAIKGGVSAAIISQRAEKNFVGVNCGIMDQFASAMGRANHAINLNCSTLSYEYIPIDFNGASIVISNTNVKHSLSSSAYNERRSECEKGFCVLKRYLPHINELSDISIEEFEKYKSRLGSELLIRRIKHIVYECDRVKKASSVLYNNDIKFFGKLMAESHNSLKNDYEVSCPELDFLVDLALETDGVLATRMTGGGFGGCTVSIIKNECIDNYINIAGEKYINKFVQSADFYVSKIGEGAHVIENE